MKTNICSECGGPCDHRVTLCNPCSRSGKNNPMYGTKRSESTKDKIRQKALIRFKDKTNHPMYGKKLSQEQIDKLVKSHLGQTAWNKGIKGPVSPKKGKTFEEIYGQEKAHEVKQKMKVSMNGKPKPQLSEIMKKLAKEGTHKGMFKNGHKGYMGQLGKECPEHVKQAISKANTGKPSWNKGTHPEYMQKENHPLWQGGKSFEPYTLDFNTAFKELIRDRDNYCCVVCNKPQEELGYQLSVHHIDYDKKNSFPQNCVSLCRNCHTPTNYNRQHWKGFFQAILKERYHYKYTIDQKIILDFTNEEEDICQN